MLVDEMSHNFVRKNNNYNYSNCPLKKRPFYYTSEDEEETSEVIKEEIIDVGMDDIPEPENLSTKPEDLSKTAHRHYTHNHQQEQQLEQHHHHQQQEERARSRTPSPIIKTPPSPLPAIRPSSPTIQHVSSMQHVHPLHHYSYPTKTITPPAGIAPIHPMAKKARVEVIQHNNSTGTPTAGVTATSTPLHFMASKSPLEPLNLNTPVEPLAHYATPAWTHTAAPLYSTHYLGYPPTYHRYQHPATELYPSYPIPAYSHSSPEHHPSVSPPPHSALTCPTIQRPIARNYAHWSSPDHCGLSPTSSVGSGPLRSPPPVTPEDLSSPGSESGRSSAGSTSAGTIVNTKIDKSSSSAGASTSGTTSPRSPRYSCADCNKSYSTYSGLSKHQQFHCAAAQGQAKKSFSCKFCQKLYLSLGALKMHIRTHTLPCKCGTCGKAFSRPWLLQGHIRTHTGEKPFCCPHCKRAFADRSNLRAHLQTHSDVKKYSCDRCNKTFSRMSLLTKHQEGGCPGVPVSVGYPC